MYKKLIIATALCASFAAQGATVSGPVPYLKASDIPVAGPFVFSHLETFEDKLLNTTGVAALGGTVLGPGAATDSVDADDGSVDGSGSTGHSYYSGGANLITFSFSAAALGSLPTVAGLAFTDVGVLTIAGIGCCKSDASFEAFDELGASLGVITIGGFGDGAVDGGTAEDRFVAVRHAGGISSIRVGFANSVDWEVDHLFYARDAAGVPEPA
ncbi:MAG TPA: hypothetical protein PLA97_21065, partial [Rubrivivax sp.]|nr:hypothetical protein [Rubrivivax sp.]